ncbi:MAG: YciI family protein [Gaiellaceae bacterium]
MKYALLIYADQTAWENMAPDETATARAASLPRWYSLFEELGKADSTANGLELEGATDAKVVRVRNGETIVTAGPFAETKELIGGAFITDLPDLDEAIRIAALVPAAEYGSLEIRPIVDRTKGAAA